MKKRWADAESDEERESLTVRKANGSGAMPTTELDPPLPILPKALKITDKPVECPIKSIIFKKLKEFKYYEDQPKDKLGDHFTEDMKRQRKLSESQSPNRIGNSQIQLSIEQSRLIQNIVYLREIKILDYLDKSINQLTQKDVFNHENYLDIKKLIRDRETSEKMTEHFPESVIRAKRALQVQNSIKGSNKLEELSNGGLIEDRGDGSACYKLTNKEDRTLLFESRFESGNLFLATKVSDQEYDCLMQNDINTHGHTQWFYFRVQNTRAGLPVKFNILNYNKADSMFNYGMKVTVYSEKKSDKDQTGWHRSCSDIAYFQNQIRKDFTFTKYFHTATFTHTFEHDDDTVFFAYCFPYTYTDLVTDLNTIERDPRRRKFMNRQVLCKTIAGVKCELVTITDTSTMGTDDLINETRDQKRKGVVISSRVHPGETVGSWMMRGILFFLTDPENKEAKLLRQNFVFKIIPMLNPDGVINGNYRCSLAGCDLNRRWKFPSKTIQPEIYSCKKLIKQVHAERTLVMYCDLHGHSRKPNVFMYGCNNPKAPEESRIFPLLLSKISPMFEFKASKFGVQKSKEATARVSMWKELKNVPLIYTMESTFSGMTINQFEGMHMDIPMLESMGRDLCRTLLIHQNLYVPKELKPMLQYDGAKLSVKKFSAEQDQNQNENEEAVQINRMLLAELRNNKELVKCGDGDSTSGSDSEPSEDNLEASELIKNLPIVDKSLSLALKKQQQIKKEQAAQERKGAKSPKKIEINPPPFNKKDNTSDNSPMKRNNRGQLRLFEIKEERKENETPPKSGKEPLKPVKPKPEMVDAVTQTERSDYHILKMRALKKQLHKLQAEAAEAKNSQEHQIAEMKTREAQQIQLRVEKLQQEDPKVSAAPRSGVNQAGSSDYSTQQPQPNPFSPEKLVASSSSVRDVREPRDVVVKSNVIKTENQNQQLYNQYQNNKVIASHPVNGNNQMIQNYITNQKAAASNPYWSSTNQQISNQITTERNKAPPYFQTAANSSQAVKITSPQVVSFDNRKIPNTVKNHALPQRGSQLSQGGSQPPIQMQLQSNHIAQRVQILKTTCGKSTSQPHNQNTQLTTQNKFNHQLTSKIVDSQIISINEKVLSTPQKIQDNLESMNSDLANAGRYASLQHSQQVQNKQQIIGGSLSGTMTAQKNKKQNLLNFNSTVAVPGTVMVNSIRHESFKMSNQQDHLTNNDEEKKQNKMQTKNSIPSLNPLNVPKVITIGGLPEVSHNNNIQQKEQNRHGVLHQQNCIRPPGKIQIGSTLSSQFATDGKKSVVPINKILSDKSYNGETDSGAGSFLPVFQARKS